MEKWVKKTLEYITRSYTDLKYKIQVHLLNFYNILFNYPFTKSVFFAHIVTSKLQFSLFQK